MQNKVEMQTMYPRRLNKTGYYQIYVNNKWILEHRFIVEEYIKRELKPEEAVHHINLNKKDNRIDNLILFPNGREHIRFHLKIQQFGWTNPVIRQIEHRWDGFKQ